VVGAATDNLTVQKDSPSDVGMSLDAKTVFLASTIQGRGEVSY